MPGMTLIEDRTLFEALLELLLWTKRTCSLCLLCLVRSLLALPRVTMCQLHSSCQLWSPANKMHCRRQLPSFPASKAPEAFPKKSTKRRTRRIKSRTILMEGWMKGEGWNQSKLSLPLIENPKCWMLMFQYVSTLKFTKTLAETQQLQPWLDWQSFQSCWKQPDPLHQDHKHG